MAFREHDFCCRACRRRRRRRSCVTARNTRAGSIRAELNTRTVTRACTTPHVFSSPGPFDTVTHIFFWALGLIDLLNPHSDAGPFGMSFTFRPP